MRPIRCLVAAALALSVPVACLAAPPSVGGCQILPTNNFWNTRVDNLPVLPISSTWVNSIGAATNLHPDWGQTELQYGIPYTTVPGSQAPVPITYSDFGDESDPGPFPIPPDAPVEGNGTGGDQHVLVIDTGHCILYELYNASLDAGGSSWSASSGAKFDLKSNALRTDSWTSADAAGYPIFPGLARWEEVAAGEIDHALRFTALHSYGGDDIVNGRPYYLWPARHVGPSTDSTWPPYGARFRLKASFDISTFTPETQVILRALKKYGMVFADQGANWYISGTTNANWPDAVISELKSIAGGNFEAVNTASMMLDYNSGAARQRGEKRDLSGDGEGDLLWSDSADGSVQGWLMNGLTATQTAGLLPGGGGYSVAQVADLDGDGKADLLIRNADGSVIGWLMNGLSVTAATTFVGPGSGWSVVKTADLDGDGKADLIWQHTDGTVQAWLMNGLSVTSTATFVGAGSGWSVSQVADLDGDGKDDLIWQHTDGTVQAWLMNGLTAASIASYVPAGTGWSVVLTGDFNGDGKTDLFWQHTDGSSQAWLMNGLTVAQVASFTPAGTGWTPMLAGDLNGDGNADIFWQHTSGASQTWLMDVGLRVSSLASFVPRATGWSATHLVDLDGDGKKDVLWHHTSGAVQAWIMNGLTITQIASLAGAGTFSVVP
jgi:hypothetical protein